MTTTCTSSLVQGEQLDGMLSGANRQLPTSPTGTIENLVDLRDSVSQLVETDV